VASGSFGSSFQSVDEADAPDELLAFLDRVAEVPAVREMKRAATLALSLVPGERVLDIGCGTGVDLGAMAGRVFPGGSVVGVDSSRRAIEAASRRVASESGVSVQVADAHELPFADRSFEAVRADRVLLHLAQPERALSEVRRVLAPSGRLVALETWATLAGEADVLRDPVGRRVGSLWRPEDQGARIEFFLPLLLARAGFAAPTLERGTSESRSIGDADAMLRLGAGVEAAVAGGTIARPDGEAWLRALESSMRAGEAVLRLGYVRLLARAG